MNIKRIPLLFSLVIVSVLLNSCEKDFGFGPDMPTEISGFLTVTEMTNYSVSPASKAQYAAAIFGNGTPGKHTLLVNEIKVNGHMLGMAPDSNSYGLTSPDSSLTTLAKWEVIGSGDIPSFSYEHTGVYPLFTGLLPSSINSANDLTLNFSIQGADNATFHIWCLDPTKTITKFVNPNSTSLTFSSGELAAIKQIAFSISVELIRDKNALIGGKRFRIGNHTHYSCNVNIQ